MAAHIRNEAAEDHDAVRMLLLDAFNGDDVPSRLVELLRDSSANVPGMAFVATVGERIVGYAKLTILEIHGDRSFVALNLTPVGVAADHQGRGIGRMLVEHALRAAEEESAAPLVIVEGDPSHYQRYGFRRASAADIERPSPRIPDAAFQFRPLSRYHPDQHRGRAEYPQPFHELDAFGP